MRINRLLQTVVPAAVPGLLILILLTVSPAAAQTSDDQVPVTSRILLSVDKLRPGDDFELAVEAAVAPGLHIGSHEEDSLYPAQLEIEAPDYIDFGEPVFPKAQRKAFGADPDEKLPVYEGTFVIRVAGSVSEDAEPGSVKIITRLDSQACEEEQCFLPQISESEAEVEIAEPGAAVAQINPEVFAAPLEPAAEPSQDEAGDLTERLETTSLLGKLGLLFGLGLLLAFTPCVYPMIPVTVGYFSSQEDKSTKKSVLLAAVYVLGLALTYSILGAVAALTGGVFGSAMQSPEVLIGIAVVLVALALSMFGLYELQPPSFIMSRASGKSGILGALVMGLIFGIVAAPCVGPVVLGLMLYVAQIGSPSMGFLLFFVLALGLGTPLFFLAAFSANLPAPGMWMVAVKKAGGFLLLGAAAYFLLPVVPDSIGRFLIPAVIAVGGIYLGFFDKAIRSGKTSALAGKVLGLAAVVIAVFLSMPGQEVPRITWQPYQPNSIQQAADTGKPSMVDFTAEWCAVCEELEDGPFIDPEVIAASEDIARYRVDGTNIDEPGVKAAVKEYGIKGWPTVIFFDNSGQETGRIVGYADSKRFLEMIEAAR